MISCHNDNVINDIEPIKIEPEKLELQLSNFFDSYKIIQFVGIDLANIKDIIDIGDRYVVLAKGLNSDIHSFDKEGVFISSIILRGRANNESLNISDVTFDKINNMLYVLDCNMSLIGYCIEQEKIINRIKLPFSVSSVEKLDEDRFVLYNEYKTNDIADCKIYTYNYKTKQIENKYLPIDEKITQFATYRQKNNLYKKNDNIIFYAALDDNGYKINKDSISTYFRFDRGVYKLNDKLLRRNYNSPQEFQNACVSRDNIWIILNCFEYNQKLISLYRIGSKEVYMNVADLQTKASNSYNIINDDMILNKKVDLSTYQIIASDDNGIYCLFEYENFINDTAIKQSVSILDADNGNPIIVFFK